MAVQDVKMVEHQTQPPDYLTEAELITLMEKHGIGTDASIPVHINNVCQRNYVSVASGRRLIPTTLGIVLVHGYQKVLQIQASKRAIIKQIKPADWPRVGAAYNEISRRGAADFDRSRKGQLHRRSSAYRRNFPAEVPVLREKYRQHGPTVRSVVLAFERVGKSALKVYSPNIFSLRFTLKIVLFVGAENVGDTWSLFKRNRLDCIVRNATRLTACRRTEIFEFTGNWNVRWTTLSCCRGRWATREKVSRSARIVTTILRSSTCLFVCKII